MKVKKIIKNMILFWLMAVLLAGNGITIPATAASQEGSIKLQLPGDMSGVEITLYETADFEKGSFVYNKDFADCKVEISDLGNSREAQEAAEKLAAYAKEKKIKGTVKKADDSGSVTFSRLSPALYVAAQTSGEEIVNMQPALVPIPYTSEAGQGWIYDAVISPKYSIPGGDALVTKVDTDGKSLKGAEFVLQQKVYLRAGEKTPEGAEEGSDDKGTYYWKEFRTNLVSNENGQIVIQDMVKGDYRLVEVKAPAGHIKLIEPKYFTVSTSGQVTEVDGVYVPKTDGVTEVSVVNQPTSLRVDKVDENGNQLAGAKLMIKTEDGGAILDENGKPKYIFTTSDEPSVLKALPAGKYLVTELIAPDGFQISPDVPVTVSDALNADNHVTVTDKTEQPTDYSLTVTKSLTDMDGMPVTAKNGEFYVALFSDEQHTQRVSSVLPIHFVGSSSGSVTFYNLKADTPYYVGETDEMGNYIDADIEVDDSTYFVPLYPDDTKVTIDEETGEEIYSFENVFLWIPDGFSYEGEITITKKVLKDNEDYNTDNVYYCAIFRDKDCTERVGDVIELAMEGGCESSVTVPVEMGDSKESVFTYYIKETDEDGIPLDDADDLEFVITQDKDKVDVSYSHNQEEVVITNSYGETTPTPTPSVTSTPTTTPTTSTTPNLTPGGGSTPGTSGSSPVKTGDNTKIMIWIVLLIAAAGCVVVVVKKKKGKK